MADGMILPMSVTYPTNGKVFYNQHVGAGANFKRVEGHGVIASLDADAILELVFPYPYGAIPSGTAKLRVLSQANATSGVLRINPSCASVAITEDPHAATYTAEGDTDLTWAAAGNDKIKETKISLAYAAPVAGKFLYMALKFKNSGTTLAVVSNHNFGLIWE